MHDDIRVPNQQEPETFVKPILKGWKKAHGSTVLEEDNSEVDITSGDESIQMQADDPTTLAS